MADERTTASAPSGVSTLIPAILADGTLSPIEKLAAHQTGAFHLAISVFVFRGDTLLIQRRALDKYHSGGQWANTCCTHPLWGEDIESAAIRRLREELGFEVPLAHAGILDYRADVGDGLYENERVHLYVGETDDLDMIIAPDPAEVSATRWITLGDLRSEIEADPSRFTPWLRIYLERFPMLEFRGVAAVGI